MCQATWPDPSPPCPVERTQWVLSPPPLTAGYGQHRPLQHLMTSCWTKLSSPVSGGIDSRARGGLARPYKAARCSKPHRSSLGASPSPTAERAGYIDFQRVRLRASWRPQTPRYWSNLGPLGRPPPLGCGVPSLAATHLPVRDASSSRGEDEGLSGRRWYGRSHKGTRPSPVSECAVQRGA